MLTLLVCWVVFPVVLATLAFGAGLLLERMSGARMATALLVPSGVALLIVVAGLTTLTTTTAPLTTPLVVGLGAAGLVMGLPRVRGTVHAPAAAVAAFLAVGAPVLLSGAATFAGYIVIDDTATFLAIGDHVLDEGRSLAGLAPSSYEAVLDAYVGHGYPIGSILLPAIGHQLTGQDLAWLYQPYLALLAGMLALALFVLLEKLVPSPLARAGMAALGAQPALLYGYAQWGGIKELTAAALLPLIAIHAARLEPGRRTIPAAVAVAALLGVLSVGAMVLATVALAPALWPWRRAVALAAITVALALPALTGVVGLLEVSAPQTLTAGTELGNLARPLRFAQVLGVWPAGDFRRDPSPPGPLCPFCLRPVRPRSSASHGRCAGVRGTCSPTWHPRSWAPAHWWHSAHRGPPARDWPSPRPRCCPPRCSAARGCTRGAGVWRSGSPRRSRQVSCGRTCSRIARRPWRRATASPSSSTSASASAARALP